MISIAPIFPQLIVDLVSILVGYVYCVWVTLRWVHRTEQDSVSREKHNDWKIAIRAAIVFGVLGGVCINTSFPVWAFYILFVVLIAIAHTGNELSVFGIIVLYPLQQYLLGFPDRREFEEIRSKPPSSRDEENSASRALVEHIGKRGRSLSQLKPSGEVLIGDERYPGISETGDFIDEGEPIIVTAVRNGALVVARIDN